MPRTVLITGIGGLTPRSIAQTLRRNHPNCRIIGCDIDPRAIGFFMNDLVDEGFVCPRCDDAAYFPWINRVVESQKIDYAFVQPEAEIVAWANYKRARGAYPCPTLMGGPRMTTSLRDKSVMASLLKETAFIPRTIKVTQDNPKFDVIREKIGFPCWIRATQGTGGLASLKLEDMASYRSWLFINASVQEFTVSEFLPGRHLANEMLYFNGEYLKGAALECAEYVMASTSPSRVTGNTRLGRLLNDDRVNSFCDSCIEYLEETLEERAHGVLSFDLKEDSRGNLKVTEVNIRHMAYTGVMAQAGFDLIEDTVSIIENGDCSQVERDTFHHWDKPYVFLRDVDVEPILLEGEEHFLRYWESK